MQHASGFCCAAAFFSKRAATLQVQRFLAMSTIGSSDLIGRAPGGRSNISIIASRQKILKTGKYSSRSRLSIEVNNGAKIPLTQDHFD
jgi:hypothetical protein